MAETVWHGMEILTAGKEPTVDECLRFAREADVLVGIIVHRYGRRICGTRRSSTS